MYRLPNRSLGAPGETGLARARSGDPAEIAMSFLRSNAGELGLTAEDLDEAVLRDRHTNKRSGVTHLYYQQEIGGVEVRGAVIGIHVNGEGRVIRADSSFMTARNRDSSQKVEKTPVEAVARAADHLGYEITDALSITAGTRGADRETRISDGGFARGEIVARLTHLPIGPTETRSAWTIEIKEPGGRHHWFVDIDAETGKPIAKRDIVIAERFEGPGDISRNRALHGHSQAEKTRGAGPRYEVFAIPNEYPTDGPRTIEVDPADPVASPFGWHDTDGAPGAEHTITRGNNVHAFLDRNGNDSPDPGADVDGGADLDFTGPLVALDLGMEPETYANAAAVNLFYWVNTLHDVLYYYGFDEASGNFQVNNYGNGGAGGDDVIAYAQKGADVGDFNNAFFGTPSDGSRPEMLMLVWNHTTPKRDGDFSSMIMAHEFGHGVSNRLTGGPGNVGCLNNGEQMGEGWSDFIGLVLTAQASDADVTPRGVGTYALGQPISGSGIRERPYSTDLGVNEFTYADLPGQFGAHPVGFVWATMLWEVYWALTNEYGFNPNFTDDWSTGGNLLALQLVIDGMKLQPCSPGFVDGRDAILQADIELTGGANQCLIWEAFAKRGLGVSASQGSSGSTTDGTAAFDVPSSCDTFGVPLDRAVICAGNDAVYTIEVGSAWGGPVGFSASGNPAGTSVSFDPAVIDSFPGQVTMTVSSTGGVAADSYAISVTGTDGTDTDSSSVDMEVFDTGAPTPMPGVPTNGQVDVDSSPILTWTPGAQTQMSTVQVARDAGFSQIVFTMTTAASEATVTPRLDSLTNYYWRVRAENPCSESAWSSTISFTTSEIPDYFTEQFGTDSNNDMDGRTTFYLPDGTNDYYRLCGEDAVGFPTDPTGGTSITLSDDDSEPISLTQPVMLYGQSYSTIYVGSNGYVTFTGSDTDYSESLSDHFSEPRVSGLFDDLNPSSSGEVSYRELADRVAITWLNVPEYDTSNSNNFQIELFFNGDIAVTHLDTAATDGITGISEGNGVPDDYFADDLSAAVGCDVVVLCPADISGDMVIDATDMEMLIEGWGIHNLSHDVNGDGGNDIRDLVMMPTLYGDCPM